MKKGLVVSLVFLILFSGFVFANGAKETAGSVTAAGKVTSTGVDVSKQETVIMYLIGDRPVDNDLVLEKINERLLSEINTKLEIKYMSWGEYEQKYPLIFASGEDWDIIYTADWCFYNAQAVKQGFWEITEEALAKYAPMTNESMYDAAWEQAKVGDKVFMLPMNYNELTAYVWMARGDLMDKYGIESLDDLDDVESYLQVIADNEKTMIPINVGSDYDVLFIFDRLWENAMIEHNLDWENVGPWQVMGRGALNEDGSVDVKGTPYIEVYKEVITKLQDWKNRGFWSKNAIVNTQNNTESFRAGKSALGLMNINTAKSFYTSIQAEHPEWDIRVFDAQGGYPAVIQSYIANGMSIFSKSKHPERALMVLDYLRNDPVCHDLFAFGIEGVHYEKSGDDSIISLPQSGNYPYDGNCNWGVRNDALWRTIAGGIPNYSELITAWNENARTPYFLTFVFDDSSVKNEIAAMGEIFGADYKLLGLGYTDDVDADIQKIQNKLKAAGADKVYSQMKQQAEAFAARQ